MYIVYIYVNLVQIIEALWDDVEVSSLPGDPLGLEAGIIKLNNNVYFEGKNYDIEFYFTKKVEIMMKKGKSNCEKKKGNRSIQK